MSEPLTIHGSSARGLRLANRWEVAGAACSVYRGVSGFRPLSALNGYPVGTLEDVFRVNALAPLALIQELLPRMSPGGSVVNLTSSASVEAYPGFGFGGYGASKAALDQMNKVLGAEHPELRFYPSTRARCARHMGGRLRWGRHVAPAGAGNGRRALLRLLNEAPASGRYLVSEFASPMEEGTA